MGKLYIAMYHYTRELKNSRYPDIKGLDIRLFQQQLDFFQAHFTIVTMEEVMEYWNGSDKKLPENALLLTFDDGYIDNFMVAYPILKNKGLQGSFFIPGKAICENRLLDVNKIHFTLASANEKELLKDLLEQLDYYRGNGMDNYPSNEELFEKYAIANRFDTKETIFIKRILQTVIPEQIRNCIASNLFQKYVGLPEHVFARELYLNHEQIRCMKKDGMFIGPHGYEHYWLNHLEKTKIEQDIEKSLSAVEEFIQTDAWVMNYPYGSYGTEVVDCISKKGCKLGLTTETRIADLDKDSKYLLPRLDCNDFPPKSENFRRF